MTQRMFLIFVSLILALGAWGGCGLEVSSCTSESTDLWLYCEKIWTCDDGVFKVTCWPSGDGGMTCTCDEEDQEVGSFKTSGACDDAVLSDYNVSSECSWTL